MATYVAHPRPAAATDAANLPLGSIDMRVLARRAAVPAALAAVVAGAVVVAGGPLRAFADAMDRALQADPRWVAGAAAFELLSFAGYIALFWMVGSRASARLDARASTYITLGGAGATRLLPTAGVGGAALTLWTLRRAGLGTGGATRTLLSFLVLLYAVFLAAIVAAGGLLALGVVRSDAPLTVTALPAGAAALALAAALLLGTRRADVSAARPATGRLARLRGAGGVVGAGVRDGVALLRAGDPRLLGAPAYWAFDAAVLWAMLEALGGAPALAIVALAYFVGQVGNTLPIPGAVSGGMVGVLVACGVQADLALVSVLAYRSIAIWLPAPLGVAALRPLRRTVAAWARDGAAAA